MQSFKQPGEDAKEEERRKKSVDSLAEKTKKLEVKDDEVTVGDDCILLYSVQIQSWFLCCPASDIDSLLEQYNTGIAAVVKSDRHSSTGVHNTGAVCFILDAYLSKDSIKIIIAGQALTLGLWMQWPGGPVDLKTYWPPQKTYWPPKKLTGPFSKTKLVR